MKSEIQSRNGKVVIVVNKVNLIVTNIKNINKRKDANKMTMSEY